VGKKGINGKGGKEKVFQMPCQPSSLGLLWELTDTGGIVMKVQAKSSIRWEKGTCEGREGEIQEQWSNIMDYPITIEAMRSVRGLSSF